MCFLEKKSEKVFIIRVQIKPNAKAQQLIDNGKFLTIFLQSKPIQNKANKELINLLRKKLRLSSSQIQIISGIKASNKLIQINFLVDMEEQNIYNKLLK